MTARRWGVEKLVNTTVATNQGDPAISALADGGFVIVWEDSSAGNVDIRGQRFDAAGNKASGEIAIVTGAGDQTDPSVAGLSGGGFVVSYNQGTDALGKHFNAAGTFLGSFDPADPLNSNPGTSVSPMGSGFAVAYSEQVAADIRPFVQFYDSNHVAIGGPLQLPDAFVETPDIAQLANGNLVITWESSGFGIGGRIVQPDRTIVGVVAGNTTPADTVPAVPTVTALANGGFVVTFQTTHGVFPDADPSYSVHARLFDPLGGGVGNDFLVNTVTAGNQSDPEITPTSSGGFLAVWTDQSTGSAEIHGQQFDAFGARIGVEFQINTTIAGTQSIPVAAPLADGRIAVTWQDSSASGGDTSGNAVRMQIIDPRDGLVSGTSNGDTLYGHDAFNDEINGYAGGDTVYGLDGNDFIYGGEGNDTLNGNEGDDRFYGGPGTDTFSGGFGDDWFFIEDAGDLVNEPVGEGPMDRVFSSISYTLAAGAEIEKFSTADHAGTAAVNLTGNALPDNIFGNAGANTLDGKGGADAMTGFGGDDFYHVDNPGDVVIEGAGGGTGDRVFASVSYTLGAGQQIEKLTTENTADTAALNFTGNEFANLIFGNAGPNILDGKGGADTMFGFGGDDLYYVDNAGDAVIEGAAEGTADRVLASVNYTLGAGVRVEKLTTDNNAGTAPLILVGNEFDNAIFGNAGNNSIRGMAGNDTLFGLGGADAFMFNTALNAATNVDTILDFASDDDFLLAGSIFSAIAPGTLAAPAFVIGAAATTAAHRIIYNAGALLYDPDGVGAAAAVQFATLSGAPAVTNADFMVF